MKESSPRKGSERKGARPPQSASTSGSAAGARPPSALRPDRLPLVRLFDELFSLARGLRAGKHVFASAEGRTWIQQHLDQAHSRGRDLDYASVQLDDAKFAVVALLDETILSSSGAARQTWQANPLQRELYGTHTAGQEFYARLRAAQKNPEENRALLEVYLTCLGLGFEGQYIGKPDERETVITALADELSRDREVDMQSFSPGWRPPDGFPDATGMGIPIRVTVLVLLGIMVLSVIVFAFFAQSSADNIAHEIYNLFLGVES